MINTKQNESVGYIDLLRGFGIICMVMGHIGFGTLFDKLIHCFHMPMFYIVSGYFYHKPDDGKNYFKRKVNTLLKPYLIFGFAYSIIAIMFLRDDP